ncbi:porin family protein [Microbulbifer epialgicus]|uniref:Porin family protein n=1 Tax=Microbulbifer epialgicus TaxID=393907 RepID=A0ABV4P402_9GAMM
MKLSKVLFLLPALTLPIPSHAEEKPFYLGLGYGFTEIKGEELGTIDEVKGIFSPGQRFSEDTNSLDLYAGYQFNDYFSIELNYSSYDQASDRYYVDPRIDSMTGHNDQEELEVDTISLNGILSYPLAENLNIFALVGFTSADIDGRWFGSEVPVTGEDPSVPYSDTESGISYGLGVSYTFTERLSSKLQWKTTDIDHLELEALHLSLAVNF